MSDNEEGYMVAQSIFDIRNNHQNTFKNLPFYTEQMHNLDH